MAKTLFGEIAAMFMTGDTARAGDLFAAGYVDHQGLRGEVMFGPDGFRTVVEAARAAYDRLYIDVSELKAQGDTISARFRWRGLRGSEQVADRETVEVLRIADGRVVEHWGTRIE